MLLLMVPTGTSTPCGTTQANDPKTGTPNASWR
nr:MAG TPA: hypothetical protein [Caudoviricetes sp.]